MAENQNNTESSVAETVPGGSLPDWEVQDLPAPPPYRFGGAFRNILGPGIIALGGSIGSGEWLLGPAITAQYGGRLLWIATIAIFLQAFLNTESHTLYRLYGRANAERLYAVPSGVTVLGVLLFNHRLLRDLARLGDGGGYSRCCGVGGVYAG